jgi:hypothetical protein
MLDLRGWVANRDTAIALTIDIAFTFVSDEFDGVTWDNDGNLRPLVPRSFSSLSQAKEENDQSRSWGFSTSHSACVTEDAYTLSLCAVQRGEIEVYLQFLYSPYLSGMADS